MLHRPYGYWLYILVSCDISNHVRYFKSWYDATLREFQRMWIPICLCFLFCRVVGGFRIPYEYHRDLDM